MSEIDQLDESRFVHRQDLAEVYAQSDPVQREAMICSITTYRSANKLDVGDPIPYVEVTTLDTGQVLNLGSLAQEQPLVLFFGSYT
jgi:hypothetical protein